MATDSRYSHPGQTHSGLPKCYSRPVILAKPTHHDRVASPPRNSEPDIREVGNSCSGHVYHSPQHASSPGYISSSGATGTGDRCSVTRLAGEVHVHVSTVSPVQQSHLEAQDQLGGLSNTKSPLVAITTVVSKPTTPVCGPPLILSITPRPTVTRGIYLELQVIPSARAWRLSCSTTKQQDFQTRSLDSPQLLGDPLQIKCMKTSGVALLTGPQGKVLICLIPQNSHFSI